MPPRRSPRSVPADQQVITAAPQPQAISSPLNRTILDRDIVLKSFKTAGVKDFAGDQYGKKSNETKTDHGKNMLDNSRAAQNWLKRFEMIAKQRKVPSEDLVEISYTFFADRALDWYNNLSDTTDFSSLTWEQFKEKFEKKFCRSRESHQYALTMLNQLPFDEENYDDFNRDFETFASFTDQTPSALVVMYTAKLPQDVRTFLGPHVYQTYQDLIPIVDRRLREVKGNEIVGNSTQPIIINKYIYSNGNGQRNNQFSRNRGKKYRNSKDPRKKRNFHHNNNNNNPNSSDRSSQRGPPHRDNKKSSVATSDPSFRTLAVPAHEGTSQPRDFSDDPFTLYNSHVEEISESPYIVDINTLRGLFHPPIVSPRLATVEIDRNVYQVLLDTGSTADGISVTTFHRMQLGRDFFRYSKPRKGKALQEEVDILGFVTVQLKVHLLSGIIDCRRSLFIFDSSQPIFILGLPFLQDFKHNLTLNDFLHDQDSNVDKSSENVCIKRFDYEEGYVNNLLTDSKNEFCLCLVTKVTDERGACSDMLDVDTNQYTSSVKRAADNQENSHCKQSTNIEANINTVSIDVEDDNATARKFRNRIMKEFADVVTNDTPKSLPPIRQHEHRIALINPKNVISRKQYPLSYAERVEMTKQVEELLKLGFVRTSSSPYNSPILFVKKKDGSMRMCIDFRLLNNNTVKDKFPIPNIERLTAHLGKAKVYSKLDLMSGYYQVRVEEDAISKTAFSTDYGHYEWVVMPFGLTNAPSTFQRLMNETLRPFLGKFVQVYLDDIFIYSPNAQAHYHHVRQVLQALRKNKLIAKKKKCAFFFKEVRFLGLVISAQGIKTDPEKIEKVMNWPTPTTIKEAQSFIGLATYYRRFVKGFSKIAVPIHNFISHKAKWDKAQDDSFARLKQVLTQAPTLIHPLWDSRSPFLVHTDACGTALGYTLEQLSPEGKSLGVIAYGSKKLKGSELNYSIYDREFMAVIEALKTWKYYLMGKHFIIRTDHKSLVYLKHQNLIDSTRVARWLDFLAQYDFEIQYVKGKDNSAADALSRYPELSAIEINHIYVDRIIENNIEFNAMDNAQALQTLSKMVPNLEFKDRLIQAYKKDSFFADIYKILSKGTRSIPNSIRRYIKHYRVEDKLLYYSTLLSKPNWRLVIPLEGWLISRVIFNAHNNQDAGHFGYWKTYLNLCDMFYWKGMVNMVKRYCNQCVQCQKNNTSTQRLQGLFCPLPIPEGRWTDVTMDFVTGLPGTVNGNDMIMVICDRMSKMAHFIPVKKSLTAEQCARVFISACFRHHGIPKRLVSDKDIRFMNKFWYTIHFLLGTSLLFSTTNHPQTDGQTERTNRIIMQCLRKHCANDMLRWDEHLAAIEFAYNSTYQNSIKTTPFQLALGYLPESFKKVNTAIDVDRYSASAEKYFEMMKSTLIQAQDNIVEAQRIQEKHHNKQRRDHHYKVGDYILLDKDANGINPQYYKVQPVFYGPYRLVKKENDNAFEVDLPTMNKRDRIINVQWFKPFTQPTFISRRVPQTDREVDARISEIVTIAGFDKQDRTYDVYWKDAAPAHATTITEEQFNKAPLSLRKCLLYNARLIKDYEELTK